MVTSKRSTRRPFLKLISGPRAGRVKTSATQTPGERVFPENVVASSSALPTLLERLNRDGLSWRMCQESSAPIEARRLKQLSTSSKRSGIWGYGLRATLSARAFPTIAKEYSLLALLDRKIPITSILTAANCLGIVRRERRAGRRLDPVFRKSLFRTLRFWFNVAEASDIPRQRAIAPRYVPKLADIKAATLTDQYYVARNLTWNECEKLMGFPEGWTVAEGDSLATRSRPR